MSDTDATRARRDVVAEVDEIIEHVINANFQNLPYDVYTELFDAVDGLGVEIEKIQSENAKLRELVIALQHCRDGRCDGECPMFTPVDNNRGVPPVCEAYGVMRGLGIESKERGNGSCQT